MTIETIKFLNVKSETMFSYRTVWSYISITPMYCSPSLCLILFSLTCGINFQKFRLYLKRLSGVAQQGGISNTFCGLMDSNVKVNPFGRFDIQTLDASGQIPPQTLAALHA